MSAQQPTPPLPVRPVFAALASLLLVVGVVVAQTNAPTSNTAAPAGEGVIELSPFQVEASSDDVGYYASQSMSGTRLNTRLEDLAASITVVTKQQLLDTAAVDINDIFLYEANTEGMHQYTEFVQDRAFYNEVTTLNPQSANRVRGVGAANMARGNFAASPSIPVDTYNIDSVEISRGPNANIFGLGDASGTVNLVTMRANLDRESLQTQVRGDSYGGWRANIDVNRPLIKDALGIRIAAVRESKGFERKPASEKINRFTGALTFRPFKTTTFRGSYERYSNRYNRANTTLPRDSFSEWMETGMPVWNPNFGAAGGFRMLDGTTYTGVTAAQETALFPVGLYPNFNTFWARPSAYIDNGTIERLEMARGSTTAAPGFNTAWRYAETGSIYRRGGNAFGVPPLTLFQIPSVADKSQYDYTSINFLAPNFGNDEASIYQAELEQWFVNNRTQQLALQLGLYREVVERFDHNFLSRTDGATPIVSIDVNEFFFDGSPNPYFLRPYIFASEPRVNETRDTNQSSRATLAYQLDFTRNEGWTKWLGKQRLAAYGETREENRRGLGARERIVSDHSWTSANDLLSLPIRGATYNLAPRYYIGGRVTEPGPVIDYAPVAPNNVPGTLPFVWYGTNSKNPIVESVDTDSIIFTGSTRKREIDTYGFVWQGYLWEDRVIPTFGWRKDSPREKTSRSLNSNPTQATTTIDPETRQHDLSFLDVFPTDWIRNEGKTMTKGVVVKPLSWLNLNYNESDSFLPEPVRWDINLRQLPNPTGDGKDYGVTFKLFDNKLIGRINRYELVQKNSRSGATSGAFAARTFRFFFDTGSGGLVFNEATQTFSNGLDPWDLEQAGAQWFMAQNPGATPQQAQAYALTTYLEPFGFTQEFIDEVRRLGGGNFAEVNTVTSKGWEFELNYNPSPHWTLKVTAAQQEAVDSELSNNINDFFDANLADLEAIVDPVTGASWWQTNIGSGSTASPQNWYFVNILATLKQASANAGKPRPQTREWRFSATTNYRLAGITDHKWLKRLSVGGALRWEDKAALGYYGGTPLANGAIVDYDPSRPIYDKARTYVDLMATYDMRLFNDKVRCRMQLNVRNAFEDGRLQPFVYNPDGTPWNYRIIDPRQIILTATFDL
jgi:hypothetical protein